MSFSNEELAQRTSSSTDAACSMRASQAAVHGTLASQYIRVLAFARSADTLSVHGKASALTLLAWVLPVILDSAD